MPVDNPPKSRAQNELVPNLNTEDLPSNELDIAASDTLPENSISQDGLSEEDKVTNVGLVKSAGTLKTFTPKATSNALGVAGDLAGVAFVILSFAEHNWVGGTMGAVGLASWLDHWWSYSCFDC